MTANMSGLGDEVGQQRAGDDGPLVADSRSRCIQCGERGIPVSARSIAEPGPLLLDGYTIHLAGGDAYYHD